ncbi:MAG: hypothetical protein DWQ05_07980 [Calditrichaeota bacterium]|nr:MAG: hypothetical protein DWQ05_07980 [Calditrichota bacterium]
MKPDEKPPKSLFEQVWEVLGKLMQNVILPVLLVAGLIFLGYTLAGGTGWPFSVSNDYPIDSIFDADEKFIDKQQGGPTDSKKNHIQPNRGNVVFVANANSPADRKYILNELKKMRLVATIDYRYGNNHILVKDLLSKSRAKNVVEELQARGFTQARIGY